MKTTIAFMIAGALFTTTSFAQTAASLSNRGQEKSNWCWAANSEMVLDWSGTNTSQTEIADYAVAGADVGSYLDAGKGGWGPFRIPGTRLVFFRKGIKQVLEHFGAIKSQVKPAPLSLAEATSFLDDEKPFVIRQDWDQGSGHVMVAKAYAGSIFQIEDPWPADFKPRPGNSGVSASVSYNSLLGTQPDYRAIVFGVSGGNKWTRTLTLGKALDIVFLIDSTGSMGSYINNVKNQATNLVNNIESAFQDARIAVVDYRDFPASPTGSSGDFITRVRTPFTTSTSAAIAAINSISVGGGADIPEAVFSAITRTVDGDEIGGWREGESVQRQIILMGDAPGHNPEPWGGGKGLKDATAALLDPEAPVMLQAVHVGGDTAAGADFAALASASGGQSVATFFASDVSDLISGIINDVANGRFPVGTTANARPTFTWESPGGGLASSPDISRLWVEIQRFNPRRGWRKYKRLRVKDPTAGSVESPRNLPVGTYRWRLKGKTKRRSFEYPDGSTDRHERLGKFVEEAFTEFERVPNIPGDIEKFTQACPFSSERRYEVLFEDDPVAEKFAIRTFNSRGRSRTKVFKRSKLGVDPSGALSAVLRVARGKTFCWEIQGLNFDRRRPDPFGYN